MRTMRRRWPLHWPAFLAVGSCLVVVACSGGSDDEADAPRSGTYVTNRGVLLDDNLDPVGKLDWPEHALEVSVAGDGDIVFSSDINATEYRDCCGPDMRSLLTSGVDGNEPEPLFPGQIGIDDFTPDWSGASLLARVDPEDLTVTGIHRCTGNEQT